MEGLQHIGNAQQVASYCGVVPGKWSSGTSVKGKPGIRHVGPAKVRTWLFLCALTTKRLDPDMARWAQELEQRGKKKMVVVVAVMRKLIHIFCGMFKSRTSYDPRKAFPSHYPKEEKHSASVAA